MMHCATLTSCLHRLASSKTGHGYQEHQEQTNSLLINQLKLAHHTNIISYIINGLQSNLITPYLDSSDKIQLPLLCTFL